MTVSRVLNDMPNVVPETAERVRKAMLQLSYQPNEMARALRSSRSRTIGLLIPVLHHPFYSACAQAVQRVAKEHGYSVLLTTTEDDAGHEYQEARGMVQRGVEVSLSCLPV